MLKSHYREVAEDQDKHWWYLGMNVINKSLLDEFLPKKKGLKILDAGCGPGASLPLLQKYGDVIGIDLSKEALKYARKRGKVKKGDISKLEFKNGYFDLVVCMDVLYHTWVKDEAAALNEFFRVLKKGGTLLIREPAYNWMRGNEDVGGLTARRFNQKILRQKLKQSRFRVEKMTYANFFLFPFVFLIRVLTMRGAIKGINGMVIPPGLINKFFFTALILEAFLVKYISLPFGSSLVGVGRKVK